MSERSGYLIEVGPTKQGRLIGPIGGAVEGLEVVVLAGGDEFEFVSAETGHDYL